MKKEIKSYATHCDGCEKQLSGKEFLSKGAIDLCSECASKIFTDEVLPKVSEEKLSQWVRNIKDFGRPTEHSNDPLGMEQVFSPIIDTSKTTGINEMTEVTSQPTLTDLDGLELSTKPKIQFLEDL